jgi:hypothetical protein
MVREEHSSAVLGQGWFGPLSSGELLGSSVAAVRPPANSDRRTRAGIRDLDRATSRTRQSQRRFLIQLQAKSDGDVRGELQRYRESMINSQWSARVVDWD